MTSDEERCAEHERFKKIDAAFKAGDLAALRAAVEDPDAVPNGPMPLAIGPCLEYAIYHSPLPFIRTLLEIGANPNPEDHIGFPPLIAALSCSRSQPGSPARPDVADILGLLLTFRADPNQRGINDYTPLHMAVAQRNELAVLRLLEGGADPDLRTRIDDYETAGEMAAAAGLTEIAELIARFHGHVLKYTGDGLIAYFAPPTFIIKNDAAVDSAFCGRRLVYEAINRELEAIGLPPIEVRLGLDAGEAAIVVLGSDKTKRHADLIGDAISLARKIESRAGTGEIFLGETVHRNLHFSWRELCTEVDLSADWTYSVSDGRPYPLFRLDPTGARAVERPPHRP